MKNPLILLVDDDQDIRQSLKNHLLKYLTCEIFEAEDGYEALDLIGHHRFDLIVMDINLPGINGIDVLSKIRQNHAQTRVLVVTGWDSDDIAQKIQEFGGEYIPKPIALNVVRLKIEQQLELLGLLNRKDF